MAKLNFPGGASSGDTYTGDNGINYIYDGVKWVGGVSISNEEANTFLTVLDVVTEAPSGNGSLAYDDAGTFTFTPANVRLGGGGGGGASYLDDLLDVNASAPVNGQVLKYNGTAWVAAADSVGAFTPGTGISINSNVISLANTSVAAGTYGNATTALSITVDAQGRLSNVITTPVSTLIDTSTIERFRLNYNASGLLVNADNVTDGITNVTVESAAGGDVSITFNSTKYNHPPSSVMLYGYDYANNKYLISHLSTSMGLREIAGGGTSGSPTAFNGGATQTIRLRLREAETGASRSFGTATHAWIQFTMYD
jgi:hypothetical protein